jgi:uncharacterized membrane protein YuzA (DUF378 family)
LPGIIAARIARHFRSVRVARIAADSRLHRHASKARKRRGIDRSLFSAPKWTGTALAGEATLPTHFKVEDMTTLDRIALILVIIGAINWGLVGLFQFDLVAAIFGGQGSSLARIVYIIVGIAGLYCLVPLFRTNTRRLEAR